MTEWWLRGTSLGQGSFLALSPLSLSSLATRVCVLISPMPRPQEYEQRSSFFSERREQAREKTVLESVVETGLLDVLLLSTKNRKKKERRDDEPAISLSLSCVE